MDNYEMPDSAFKADKHEVKELKERVRKLEEEVAKISAFCSWLSQLVSQNRKV